ncbi:MAG: NAD(P)H-binding protein [Anaerolineales bacterium]
MIQKILVIGGTGMLGEPVARRLQAEGFGVRIFTRSPEKAKARFPASFEIADGDVEEADSLAVALEGCQGVHINLHGLSDPDLERRGGEMVARAASKAGLERISYLSGASVCQENAWFPDTQARLLAENAIRASGIPYTIFRANYFMETLRNFVHGRLLLQIGNHPHPYQWVAAGDYARMVAKAYATPQAAGKTLYVCGPQAMTMRAALEVLQRAAYPNYRIISLPIRAARMIAWAGRRRELQSALPFFAYCEKVKIFLSGSPDEANALLGAPATTLETWARGEA